jgi:hypothetical protein
MKIRQISVGRLAAGNIRRAFSAVAVGAVLAAMTPAIAQVYVRVGPPVARVEVVPPRPGPGWAWHPGRWDWRGGRWVWLGGRYVRGPRVGAAWVTGHWVHRPRGWVYVRGHWR